MAFEKELDLGNRVVRLLYSGQASMIKRLPPRADGQFLIQTNIQARYLTSAQK